MVEKELCHFCPLTPKSGQAKSKKINICKLSALWCFNNSFLIIFIWFSDFSLMNKYNFIIKNQINIKIILLKIDCATQAWHFWAHFPSPPPTWGTYSATDSGNLTTRLKRKSSEPTFFPCCRMREKAEHSPLCTTHKSLKSPTQQRRNLHQK